MCFPSSRGCARSWPIIAARPQSVRWRKTGLVYAPDGSVPWMASHAGIPLAWRTPLGEDRIYFSARDREGRAHIAYASVEWADEGPRVLRVCESPVLGLGETGAFDDSGVMTSCIVGAPEDRVFLYYTGWSRGVTVPFYFYGGLAISRDGGATFERHSEAPILERCAVDPYLTASPWVIREADRWRMWYISCVGWRVVDGKPQHRYHVRYAESADGIAWDRRGAVAIDFASEAEYALARPFVTFEAGRYRMWFSHRGSAYRMGYAESADGLHWVRDDAAAGIEVSAEGWDSEMVAYPFIESRSNRRYLLYNGNGYGRTGFGCAYAER